MRDVRSVWSTRYIGAFICACLALLPGGLSAHDRGIDVPRVPTELTVPAGHRPYLLAHATGSQNFICLPGGTGFAWAFLGPQATLFDDYARQVGTHHLSLNPDEVNLARATWQHSDDTSRVWANSIANSSNPAYVEPGALPWLLLKVVGADRGPTRGEQLAEATYIHRVNTVGGLVPATGCATVDDFGRRIFVPYAADYVFYKSAWRHR